MLKKLMLLNFVVFFIFSKEEIKFHAYHINLWKEDKIPLEYPVYKLLKRIL